MKFISKAKGRIRKRVSFSWMELSLSQTVGKVTSPGGNREYFLPGGYLIHFQGITLPLL